MEKMFGGMSDVVHGPIKRFFVRLRRFRKAAELADELKRRRVNFIFGRWRQEVMKGFDISAHRVCSRLFWEMKTRRDSVSNCG
jgi:hypothetical protein